MVKRTQKQLIARERKTTIWFGYGIFAALIIVVILTDIYPYVSILNHHTILPVWQIIVMMISFIIGTILAVIVSYFIGDAATHEKNKTSHHYNGMLFAFEAFVLAQAFAVSGFFLPKDPLLQLPNPWNLLAVNSVPVILTALVMLGVAYSYVKMHKKKTSVLEHRPYQVVLILVFALQYAYQLVQLPHIAAADLFQYLSLSVLLFVIGVVAYIVLRDKKVSRLETVTRSLLVMTVSSTTAVVAIYLASGLQVALWSQVFIVSVVSEIVAGLAFLLLIRRR